MVSKMGFFEVIGMITVAMWVMSVIVIIVGVIAGASSQKAVSGTATKSGFTMSADGLIDRFKTGINTIVGK